MLKSTFWTAVVVIACLLVGSVLGDPIPLKRRPERTRALIKKLGLAQNRRLPRLPRMRGASAKEIEVATRQALIGAGLALNQTEDLPLKGNELQMGLVYVDIAFGSPAVTYTYNFDTGSSDTAMPSTNCGTCGHPNEVYNPTKSADAKRLDCKQVNSCPSCVSSGCNYAITYGDGSGYSANAYSDISTIGNYQAYTQQFGAIFKESGEFEVPPVDGISGWAYQSLSEIKAPTPMDNLVASGQASNVFSICLTDDGGSLEVGGQGQEWAAAGSMIQWTPIVLKEWYTIHVNDVIVNNQSLGVKQSQLNAGGAIVDSGTTLMYLPSAAYKAFHNALLANCDTNPLVGVCGEGHQNLFSGYCFDMTDAQRDAFPDVVVSFGVDGKTQVAVPPKYYLSRGECGDSSSIALMIGNGGREGALLGDTFLKSVVTIHDRENSRIGFSVIGNCPDGNKQ